MRKFVIFFLLFVLFLPILLAFSPSDKNYIVSKNALEKEVENRKFVGLNHDKSYVKNILEQKDNSNYVYKFEMYLTKEEANKLEARFKHQDKTVPLVLNYINQNLREEIFAGFFVKQSEGGVLYVGIANDKDQNIGNIKRKIKELYKKNNMVKFFNAKYSFSELRKVHEKILNENDTLKKEKIYIVGVSTDVEKNRVGIGVKNLSKYKINKLKEMYGDIIYVFEQDEEENDNVVVQGGTPIDTTINGNGDCSVGFSAYSGSTYYVVTAGHCSTGYTSDTWYQGSDLIGTMYLNNVVYSGDVDAALITLYDRTYASQYVHFNGSYGINLAGYISSGGYNGMRVCFAGKHTEDCGYIIDNYYSTQTGLQNTVRVSFDTQAGDSGGIFFSESTNNILGVLSGSTEGYSESGRAFYTKVGRIIDTFGINPVY